MRDLIELDNNNYLTAHSHHWHNELIPSVHLKISKVFLRVEMLYLYLKLVCSNLMIKKHKIYLITRDSHSKWIQYLLIILNQEIVNNLVHLQKEM
jgi:hypothetical protein